MIPDENAVNSGNDASREAFTVRLTSPMLYDRLHILSAEYSISIENLVNAAVQRLIDEVDFVRSLRMGRV